MHLDHWCLNILGTQDKTPSTEIQISTSRRILVKLVTLIEAIVFMLPLSIGWLFGVWSFGLEPVVDLLTGATLPSWGAVVIVGWLAFCGMGLCAFWELFLRYDTYTLQSLPRRVRVGIILGLIAVIAASLKDVWSGLIFVGILLALLVQFYYLIRRNGVLPPDQ